MTSITSKTHKNRSFQLRVGFFNVAYQDESKIVKTENRENTNVQNKLKNKKNEIKKIEKNMNKKINEKNMKINENDKKKINEKNMKKIETGLNIIQKIVLIGSALSGLLPSLRHAIIRQTIQ